MISGLILGLIFGLLNLLGVIIVGLYNQISFVEIIKSVGVFFISSTSVPNWIIILASIALISFFFLILQRLFNSRSTRKTEVVENVTIKSKEKTQPDLTGDQVMMAAAGHRKSASVSGSILESTTGAFSVWAQVTDIHNSIQGSELNWYVFSYASNGGKEMNNPSLARYPNSFAVYRVPPTHTQQLGSWQFLCNSVGKATTRLFCKEVLSNGWHLFTVAWSEKENYIKFIIDDKLFDGSKFTNWPSDFTHSIIIGTSPTRAPEFYFNSYVGQWYATNKEYNDVYIKNLLQTKPK